MNKLLAESLVDFNELSVPAQGGLLSNQNLKVGDIISTVYKTYIFYAAGIALLVYLIIGGFQLMLSKGDPKATQAAQSKITNALIGFVIIFLAFVIVQLFGQLFGLQDTSFGKVFGILGTN